MTFENSKGGDVGGLRIFDLPHHTYRTDRLIVHPEETDSAFYIPLSVKPWADISGRDVDVAREVPESSVETLGKLGEATPIGRGKLLNDASARERGLGCRQHLPTEHEGIAFDTEAELRQYDTRVVASVGKEHVDSLQISEMGLDRAKKH
jgi:hypothetical protein